MSRKDKKIIASYASYIKTNKPPKKDVYFEGIYKVPVKNIIDYERTLTVDEALAQSKLEIPKEKVKNPIFRKKSANIEVPEEEDKIVYNNQILNFKK